MKQSDIDLTNINQIVFDWKENDEHIFGGCTFEVNWVPNTGGQIQLFQTVIWGDQVAPPPAQGWTLYKTHLSEVLDVSAISGVGTLVFQVRSSNDWCNVAIDNLQLDP